jgi:hypothetical protein
LLNVSIQGTLVELVITWYSLEFPLLSSIIFWNTPQGRGNPIYHHVPQMIIILL